MPGFYPEDEYDLAGFAVGIVDEKKMITGADLKAGDVLIGLSSSGVHSNGFSLVRRVFEMTKESLDTYYEELGTTLGEALLAPHEDLCEGASHGEGSGRDREGVQPYHRRRLL